jgi:hypothetical protein
MSAADRYRAAIVDAQEKKARFLDSAAAAKARVSPARLKQDVKTAIGNKASNAVAGVRQRPWAFGAAGAALVLYMARRPIGSLLRKLYVRARTGQWETQDG